MWTLVETKMKILTTALAKEFSSMTPAPHDRPLSERRINVYRKLVEAGQFRPCTWACATCLETGEKFRVNGKHTSSMFSQMEIIPDITIIIEKYECEKIEDVARLYATFDSQLQSRNTADINRSFAATVPELAVLRAKVINICASGMSFFKWRTQYGQIPAAERAELLLEYIQFVLWVGGLLVEEKTCRHIQRGPVVAAMFATWQKSQKDADLFWIAVRDETGERPDCVDRKLAKYLSTINVASGNGGLAPNSRKAQPAEFYAKSIHAWNAWRNGTKSDLKFYATATVPVAK